MTLTDEPRKFFHIVSPESLTGSGLLLFTVGKSIRRSPDWVGGHTMPRTQLVDDDPTDPRPNDPPFLFMILLSAHRSGNHRLARLARDWLAEQGIRVVIEDSGDSPLGGKAVAHGR